MSETFINEREAVAYYHAQRAHYTHELGPPELSGDFEGVKWVKWATVRLTVHGPWRGPYTVRVDELS